MIARKITDEIESRLFQGRAIIIYGTRRVGKTTLGKAILEKYNNTLYLNCDEPDVRLALTDRTSTELLRFIGEKALIFIDEAQRVPNIGITLKLIIDNAPHIQIIATGSSSFDLANSVTESLAGRKYEFTLFPLSLEEIIQSQSALEANRMIDEFLVYGSYPMTYLDPTNRVDKLKELVGSYLFHDILMYENLRKPELLDKILRALALQIGSEVSYTEVANLVGTDKNTIIRYIDLLEKTFVIFRLPSFSRNLRNEIKKGQKIFFTDLGIRNALLGNFTSIEGRTDAGALWENFCILERKKYLTSHVIYANMYFWRTTLQQEVDLLEERDGVITGFECKYRKGNMKVPKSFSVAYPTAKIHILTRDTIVNSFTL